MNDLMTHVERIVRPVAATQRRKLQMRTELLAHLRAAFDEEMDRSPGDEHAAVERAARRLGDVAELTRSLQKTVPLVERVLLARVALPPRMDGLEHRLARVPGQRGDLTLAHKLVLSGLAMLAAVPMLTSIYRAVAESGRPPVIEWISLLGALVAWPVLLVLSCRFVFAAAGPVRDRPAAMRRGVGIVATQVTFMAFAIFTIAGRAVMPREVAGCAATTIATLIVSAVIAERIGVRRRAYDGWLALDVATPA